MSDEEKNPWKTLGSRIVYSNPWISVREDDVIAPSGEQSIYGVVEARRCVGIIPVDDDGFTYLVGQYRYPIDTFSWEIIEGGVDHGEDIVEGARRELLEEAGIIPDKLEVIVETVHISNCFCNEVGTIFLARGLKFVESQPDDTERLTIKKIPLAEAFGLVDSGFITDSISIIGLSRLARSGFRD